MSKTEAHKTRRLAHAQAIAALHRSKPGPCRVRRLLDTQVLVDRYGAHVVAAMPEEIIDLADGTRVCEWPDAESRPHTIRRETLAERDDRMLAVVIDGKQNATDKTEAIVLMSDRRIRYASEDDMWRDLTRIAGKAPFAKPQYRVAESSISSWNGDTTIPVEFTPTEVAQYASVQIAIDARKANNGQRDTPDMRGRLMRTVHGYRTEDLRASGDAWVDRPGALKAIERGYGAWRLRIVTVPCAEETDDRELDSQGRRNGGSRKRPGAQGPKANSKTWREPAIE